MVKTLTWGSIPPQYEKYQDGSYRIYINPEPFDTTIRNDETGEDITILEYKVYYTVIKSPMLDLAIKGNNEFQTNKLLLIERIKGYDLSDKVNSFTILGIPMWLDKNTRAGLQLRFNAELAVGLTETTLWYKNQLIHLNIQDAQLMLYALERYASTCYDCTLQHLVNVESLTFAEEFKNYDYTANYPEKLIF